MLYAFPEDTDKTTASQSFTQELKDFARPFDFFLAPGTAAETETPTILNDSSGISEIHSTNAVAAFFINGVNFSIKPVLQNHGAVFPNLVKDFIPATTSEKIKIDIFEPSGKLVLSSGATINKGNNIVSVNGMINRLPAVYFALVYLGDDLFRYKILGAGNPIK